MTYTWSGFVENPNPNGFGVVGDGNANTRDVNTPFDITVFVDKQATDRNPSVNSASFLVDQFDLRIGTNNLTIDDVSGSIPRVDGKPFISITFRQNGSIDNLILGTLLDDGTTDPFPIFVSVSFTGRPFQFAADGIDSPPEFGSLASFGISAGTSGNTLAYLDGATVSSTVIQTVIPEPTTLALISAGIAAVGAFRHRPGTAQESHRSRS
ncbi:MAG: PEP-CTERM sorting domain-containing protein [Planctomycetota bacterium]